MGNRDITHLSCLLCKPDQAHTVYKNQFAPGRDGQSRYNRMRADMVRHLASTHPGSATEAQPEGSTAATGASQNG